MDIPTLPGLQASGGQGGRGRPKGSKNKRSLDLGRYVEAVYGGMTPGQQAAAIGMVTPKDLRRAAKAARTLGLDPVVVAMANKARELAVLLGCTAKEAWDAMRAERAEVMPYIHQRLAQLDLTSKGGSIAPVILMAATAPSSGPVTFDGDWNEVEADQGLSDMRPIEVSQAKSHDGAQPLAAQGFEAADPSD